MLKYRLQWPFLVEDCYECGKGLHFRKLWKRVYKPTPLTDLQRAVIESSVRVMRTPVSSPIFSKEAIVKIGDSKTVTIPRVGFSITDRDADTNG